MRLIVGMYSRASVAVPSRSVSDLFQEHRQISISISRGVLVTTVNNAMTLAELKRFRHDLLRCLQAERVHVVICDLSELQVLDDHEFAFLRQTLLMARVMGADAIACGLREGLARALVYRELDVEGLDMALDLPMALEMVGTARSSPPAPRHREMDD